MMVFHVARKDLLLLLRDPLSLALWLGIPIMIGSLITLAFGGSDGPSPKADIWVVDQDKSFLSQMLVRTLSGQADDVPFQAEAVQLAEGHRRIEDGKGTALLIIPDGFSDAVLHEKPAALELITNPAQQILPKMVEEALAMLTEITFYLQRILGDDLRRIAEIESANPLELLARLGGDVDLTEKLKRLGDQLYPPVIKVTVEVEKKEKAIQQSLGELFLPSMLLMALFFMAQGMSEGIWLEKEQGTLRRFMATPNRVSELVAGKLLAAVVTMAVTIGLGLALAKYGLEMKLVNIALAVSWSALTGCLFMLMLMLLHLLAKTQRGGNLLTSLVMMPLLMIGGSFFPFEQMPAAMAKFGQMTPNGWALIKLKLILDGSMTNADLALATGSILAASLILFTLCVHRSGGVFARS